MRGGKINWNKANKVEGLGVGGVGCWIGSGKGKGGIEVRGVIFKKKGMIKIEIGEWIVKVKIMNRRGMIWISV
ncbi:hypothetical protein, partial [Staphylococcus warneri]|uniref:hypothetical protein n=1 Tax=Staphylococcus warneri TaxID=1292 RepID=UPI001C92D956